MQFNRHPNLEGRHALLSASSWRWINDDEESLVKRICGQYAQAMGTLLHEIARKHIKYRTKLNKYDKKNIILELLANGIPDIVISTVDFDSIFENFMTYVNDGIGFKMEPEVVLSYSDNFFGTADTIKYSEEERFLRIHDYKSGTTPAHMEQLMIYAALFCLEYRIKPSAIGIELRIYQNNEIIYHNPTVDELLPIMDKIVTTDKFMNQIKEV
jgi:hypothetical protein